MFITGCRWLSFFVRPLEHVLKMDYDYKKRGYLLPEGCKDLIDVLKPKTPPKPATPQTSRPAPAPPIAGEMTVPAQMTVGELAAALNQKPFQIIGDLMAIGVFANLHQPVDFEIITHVVRKYGYTAKKAA